MTIEELKKEIEQRAGVPASLLTGETIEENISQAKAFIILKKEYEDRHPKSAREEFSEWVNMQEGKEAKDTAREEIAKIEEILSTESSGYPSINYGGNILSNQIEPLEGTGAREAFAGWAAKKNSFNPFKRNGWTHLQL